MRKKLGVAIKMTKISLINHKQFILNILQQNGLDEDNLIIHQNPYEYAMKKHLSNTKPGMIGYSWVSSDKKFILLKEEITDQEQQDALERIAFPLDRGRKQFLVKPERFVECLVRHEIEHCVFGKPQAHEHEADEEALKKMGFSETGTKF